MLGGELVESEVAVAVDGGEEVVEVVRDPARETSDGLHLRGVTELLLRLTQRLFGLLDRTLYEDRLVEADVDRHAGRKGLLDPRQLLSNRIGH